MGLATAQAFAAEAAAVVCKPRCACPPDVAVLDASMPILNGIDAAREIKKLRPATAIVFLSMHSNTIYLRKALEAARPAGADGSGSRCRKRRRPR